MINSNQTDDNIQSSENNQTSGNNQTGQNNSNLTTPINTVLVERHFFNVNNNENFNVVRKTLYPR